MRVRPENVRRPAKPAAKPAWLFYLLGAALLAVGGALLAGGVELARLGGSLYYTVAGAALALCAILLMVRDVRAFWLFAATYAGTVIWAVWEAGLSFWPLVPRVSLFLVMGAIMSTLWGMLDPSRRRLARLLAAGHCVVIAAGLAGMFMKHDVTRHPFAAASNVKITGNMIAGTWRHYGGDAGGTHFVPLDQITPANVKNLKVAWMFRTGEINQNADFEATPIQIGDTLYFCTAHNKVFALDTDTGKIKWKYDPQVQVLGSFHHCRGVAYHAPERVDAGAADAPCEMRIITTTIDSRLIALDARTGTVCPGFGQGGMVDLTAGLGPQRPGTYFPSSAPLVADGRIIVGGWIADSEHLDEVGGVVRAYDAVTGKLAWAWDPGVSPDASGKGNGASYTRSTPNFWGTATFDAELGLIYIPTGNGQMDHWGGDRTEMTERYSTAVVALDVTTGREAWHYQTVHHDLWDWDLGAPPTFVDLPDGTGQSVPALVQVGKAGQIFVLDRRNGHPVTKVVERAVPAQGAVAGEHIAPTQPYSAGMPQIMPTDLSEKTMWGATLFDQLSCRIRFRQHEYHGQYTPPSLKGTLTFPGVFGGMNWGGVAIDPIRDILITNDIRLATVIRLRPHDLHGATASEAPYKADYYNFQSIVGQPCVPPPWGMITGIDLKTRKIVWQIPAGTTAGQFKDKIGIPIALPVGMPTLSSAIATASGLTFYAGAADPYFRAWDTTTGMELWRAPMPVGAMATPMSYISPRSGKQFLVIGAGGSPNSTRIGDYIIAYALP